MHDVGPETEQKMLKTIAVGYKVSLSWVDMYSSMWYAHCACEFWLRSNSLENVCLQKHAMNFLFVIRAKMIPNQKEGQEKKEGVVYLIPPKHVGTKLYLLSSTLLPLIFYVSFWGFAIVTRASAEHKNWKWEVEVGMFGFSVSSVNIGNNAPFSEHYNYHLCI